MQNVPRELTEHLHAQLAGLRRFDNIRFRALPQGMVDRVVDVVLEFNHNGRQYTFLTHVGQTVYPRDIYQSAWRLQKACEKFTWAPSGSAMPLILAQSISPGGKELLREQRVSYADSGGSIYLDSVGLLVWIDRPVPKPAARKIRSLFSGRRAQVLVALLEHPNEWMSVAPLAALAHTSPATASETMAELERYDWVQSQGAGPSKERRLRDAPGLLNAWTQVPKVARHNATRWHKWAQNPDQLMRQLTQKLSQAGVDYAVTMESGANLVTRYLSSISQIHIAIPPDVPPQFVANTLDLAPAEEGANVVLLQPKSDSPFLFRQQIDGISIVNRFDLYLDLLQSGGRNKEFADHFRRHAIGF